MAPAPISMAWEAGERSVVSSETTPTPNIDAMPTLPRPFLNMFFAGHAIFQTKGSSLQEKSQEYRTVMLECKDAIKRSPNADDKEHQDAIVALTHAHAVWHFVEVVYLTDYSADDRHVSEFLTEWFRLNYPDSKNEGHTKYSVLDGERPRDDDDEFWNYLIKLAIVGDINKIQQLLSVGKQEDILMDEKFSFAKGLDSPEGGGVHDRAEPEPVVSTVERVMQHFPGHRISMRTDGSWEEWQSMCKMWANAEEFQQRKGPKRLLGLFSGDTEKIAIACETWEELFVAYAIYGKYGLAAGGNLHGGPPLVSNACASASIVYKAPEEVAGGALVEAALGNLSNTIIHMEASLSSSWFSAHLCDLLVRSGHLADVEPARWGSEDRPVGIRELHLKEYARSLERYRGCWRLAVDYYTSCPVQGASHLVDLLARLPFEGTSDPTVEKALFICRKRGLTRTSRVICEKLGADCLNRGNMGAAMSWFARANLSKRAQCVAELALCHAEREGAHSEAARGLECVVTAFTNFGDDKMRETLDYMRAYCDMQLSIVVITSRGMDTENDTTNLVSEFITSVRRLVGGGGLPRRHWLVVAYEAARILELYPDYAHLFTKSAVVEILGALQLASGPHRSDDMIAGLRSRLAFEESKAGEAEEAGVCSMEELGAALDRCRGVFVRQAAARINA